MLITSEPDPGTGDQGQRASYPPQCEYVQAGLRTICGSLVGP